MPNDVQGATSNAPKPEALYAKLEDRILARDQEGASEVYPTFPGFPFRRA